MKKDSLDSEKLGFEALKDKETSKVALKKLCKEFQHNKLLNLYNENDMTRFLINVINTMLSMLGFQEELQLFHRKNFVMILAVLFGIYGSVIAKFPGQKYIILFCVFGFFLCMTTLLLIDYYSPCRGHSISFSQPSSRSKKLSEYWIYNKEAYYIKISLDRPTAEMKFEVTNTSCNICTSVNVGKLFTENGYMAINSLFNIISKLLLDIWKAEKERNSKKQL
ncbi:uncharacterized protein CMU_035490 [Cryptosporidium muris RN66]|uniref:Signal peptidase complex subunit 2 n=1 Tax=Cryptosporidium muris (strain RN66) TaxID=441375 RepID=B6AGN6_CRYMR|nr:uncharacterized protein CMU_035490 [Cryptosporidium muris RN66]EEA07377.1 hypothetical protein, conserved [Cryptosporidium muris RN66]|eukprot:XP_002141726.1 hypothetical protein [Cryptosporidium muris RN66]